MSTTVRERGRALVTGPTVEPVTRTLAKAHLREDGNAQDEVIDQLIIAAREWVEGKSWRALARQTWDISFDRFPCGRVPLSLPLAPLSSVTSVSYIDVNGVTQALTVDDLLIPGGVEPAIIQPDVNDRWPDVQCDTAGAVTVRIVCGYDTVAHVPRKFVQAMLLLIGHWYLHREHVSVAPGQVSAEIQDTVAALIDLDHARELVA